MYSKNLQILGAEGGSGLLKFWHKVWRGERRIIFRIPKKIINSAGAFFRHMRAPKNQNREDEAENSQR